MASIQKRGSRWFARYRDTTGREHGQRFDRKIDAQRWIDEATTAMVEALRDNLPAPYRAVVDLVVGSGLRQGEVSGLEVDAVTFLGSREVTVHQQLICLSPNPPYIDEVKSEAGQRVIPLAKVTTDALAAHLARHPIREGEIEDRSDPRKPVTRTARLVFTTGAGGPMTRSQWSQIWRSAAKAAGLPPRTGLHALRHFYASALIRHGESVKRVQTRLGHSSAAITLDTYTHLWPDSDDRTRELPSGHCQLLRTLCGQPEDRHDVSAAQRG